MDKNKTIDYRFRILYAIAITMVVCSHIMGGTTLDGQPITYHLGFDLLYDWFRYGSVQLAIFAFASGYFYKRSHEAHPLSYAKKQALKLLVPMYLWNFFYGWIVKITALHGFSIGGFVTPDSLLLAPLYDGNQFRYNVGGWFVVPLFLMQMFNVLVRRLFAPFETHTDRIPEWAYFIFYLCLGIFGNALASSIAADLPAGTSLGWWLLLLRPLHLLPFFALGTFYRTTLEQRDTVSSYILLPALLAAKYLIAAFLGYMPDYSPMWLNNFVHGPIMPIIVGYIGIFFWLRLARILAPAIGRSRLITTLSASTYSIMIHQFLGFMLVKGLFAFLSVVTPYFSDFRLDAFFSDIWWYYEAFGLSQTLCLYLAAGLLVPILIQRFQDFCLREWRAVALRGDNRPLPGLRVGEGVN